MHVFDFEILKIKEFEFPKNKPFIIFQRFFQGFFLDFSHLNYIVILHAILQWPTSATTNKTFSRKIKLEN